VWKRGKEEEAMRTLLVVWLLVVVTLGGVAVVSANWYEYMLANDLPQRERAAARGWEPVPNIGENFSFLRRPRLYLPR